MPDFTGQSIGRYHVIEPLGQGGMATVYRAYDTRLECEVAVKFIRMERLTREETEKALKRFEREAKELARLTHPNIVKVTDFGKYKGTPYLVMEYLPGGTLKQFGGKPMPYEQAARLLAPVARALDAAHKKNLIHRDIKPGNILLTEEGQPMVSDFGIAKILDLEGGNTLTSTNVAIGTPEYMAPEQWLNQVSAQSDIYSLGIVFYELVTGQRPYTADTPAAVFLKQANDPLPRPRSFVPGLPEEVEKVLYKALAKVPEERYLSMGEFAAAVEELGIPGKIPPPDETAFSLTSPPPVQENPAGEETRPGAPVSSIPQVPVTQLEEKIPAEPPLPQASIAHISTPGRPPRAGWKRALVALTFVLVGLAALAGLAVVGIRQVQKGIGPPAFLRATETPVTTYLIAPLDTSTPASSPIPELGIGSSQTSLKDVMTMMYVPAGEFLMGSSQDDSQAADDEKPQHTVFLDPFWIDKFEVTNWQYQQCVKASACTPPSSSASLTHTNYYKSTLYSDYPVINVGWSQAQDYCRWAGRRLPSEAEWEKAARGTDGRIYPWGEGIDCSTANFWMCVGDTTKAGSYPGGASPYGAMDMAGNALEWVYDWYSETYYQQSPDRNPFGPASGATLVLRGGSYGSNNKDTRSAARLKDQPAGRNDTGFRCAANAAP